MEQEVKEKAREVALVERSSQQFRRCSFSHVDCPSRSLSLSKKKQKIPHRSSRPSGGQQPGSPGRQRASGSPARARGGHCRPRKGARSRSGTRPTKKQTQSMQRQQRQRRRGNGGPRAAFSTPRPRPEGLRAGTRRSARPVPRATGTWLRERAGSEGRGGKRS